MKNKLFLTLLLAITLSVTLFSCKKDKEKTEPTAKELLIGKWMFISVEHSDGDIQTPQNDCQRKTHYLFSTDGNMEVANYNLDEGICTGAVEAANYTLSMDGKKLSSPREVAPPFMRSGSYRRAG